MDELNSLVQTFMEKQEQARVEQNGKMNEIHERLDRMNDKVDAQEKIRLEMRGQI